MVLKLQPLLFEEEDKEPFTPPEAPKDALFGQWLFPKQRADVFAKERDTPEEEQFFNALQDFIMSNSGASLGTFVPDVLKIMAKHEYSPVLAPGHHTVYRGMGQPYASETKKFLHMLRGWGVTLNTLMAPTTREDIKTPYDGAWAWYEHSFVLKPLGARAVQSWSVDQRVARQFSGNGSNLRVICKASTEGNVFFGKPGVLAKIVFPDHHAEQETISIGPVKCSGFWLMDAAVSMLVYAGEVYNVLFEEAPPPEAPFRAIFGQWLFPHGRNELKDVDEPDTDQEDSFRDALQAFIGTQNSAGELQSWSDEIMDLMAKHEYAPLLDPGHEEVYRGIFVPEVHMHGMLKQWGVTRETLLNVKEEKFGFEFVRIPHEFVFLPKTRRIQSWTTEYSIAADFAGNSVKSSIILEADTTRSAFFGKPGALARAVHMENKEEETISLGDVTCNAFWIAMDLKKELEKEGSL